MFVYVTDSTILLCVLFDVPSCGPSWAWRQTMPSKVSTIFELFLVHQSSSGMSVARICSLIKCSPLVTQMEISYASRTNWHCCVHEQVQEVLGRIQEESSLQDSPTYLLEMNCMIGDHSFQLAREAKFGESRPEYCVQDLSIFTVVPCELASL